MAEDKKYLLHMLQVCLMLGIVVGIKLLEFLLES